jgi:hypothetical protein
VGDFGILERILQTAWRRWQIISKINGDYIARFITTLFYYTILVPFALITKFWVDPLEQRKPTAWRARKPVPESIDAARQQS